MQDHYEGEGNEGYEGEIPQNPDDWISEPLIDPDYEVDPPETEDPMVEVSMSELANVRMLLEEAMDALANIVPDEFHDGFSPETEPGPDYPGPDPGPDYPEPELPVTFDKQFEL